MASLILVNELCVDLVRCVGRCTVHTYIIISPYCIDHFLLGPPRTEDHTDTCGEWHLLRAVVVRSVVSGGNESNNNIAVEPNKRAHIDVYLSCSSGIQQAQLQRNDYSDISP